ncbi:putative bifunctional diguanylate cyclase/phosphodiesterase [Pseudarthrobacter sp. P1]|uniref:putative bifunctional diguanylate cyclase/phosphodiesterase n=1 Tax=Pseudarthrobacter sp. P1 TaxID=3418418 RepID=UPI003CFA7BAE
MDNSEILREAIARLSAGDLSVRFESPVPHAGSEAMDELISSLDGLAHRLESRKENAEQHYAQLQGELDRSRAEVDLLAGSDMLTGARNRQALIAAIAAATAVPDGRLPGPTLVVVGLSGLKLGNEKLGRAQGDAVLIAAADTLRELISENDVIARLSNSEFAILVDKRDPEAAFILAVRILERLHQSILVGTNRLWLEASIGIRLDEDALDPEDQIRDAMLAMNYAADRARGRIEVFVPAMVETASQRVQMIADLRQAIGHNGLELHYQPVVELETGAIVGAEALVRWDHPRWGRLQPGVFLPAAEEGGLLVALGQWVLGQAIVQLRQWEPDVELLSGFKLHVNLSPGELQRRELVPELRSLLREHNVSPARLALEITENAVVTASAESSRILDSLRKVGVGLEIDDFGTGYSSISYLRSLPVDTAKIDMSLIRDVAADPQQREFVAAILMLIKAAKLDVVAEGIETSEQAEMLRLLGCRLGQGYFFSRPVAADTMTGLLRQRVVP